MYTVVVVHVIPSVLMCVTLERTVRVNV